MQGIFEDYSLFMRMPSIFPELLSVYSKSGNILMPHLFMAQNQRAEQFLFLSTLDEASGQSLARLTTPSILPILAKESLSLR